MFTTIRIAFTFKYTIKHPEAITIPFILTKFRNFCTERMVIPVNFYEYNLNGLQKEKYSYIGFYFELSEGNERILKEFTLTKDELLALSEYSIMFTTSKRTKNPYKDFKGLLSYLYAQANKRN